MRVRFDPFLASYWRTPIDQTYQVVGWSRSGRSIYIDFGGMRKLVPTAVLIRA